MKRNTQDGMLNNFDNNTGFVTIDELETIISSDLTLLNAETLRGLFNNILNTFLRFEKNHLISRREIEDLRYKVNQFSNPNSSAEQALMSITDSDREILFNRYLLLKCEEYEQAKLSAERTKVATLSSLNKIRFSLNTLLSDPVYGPDIKNKIQKIMSNIDPSVDFVQNINLPSPSPVIPEVNNAPTMLNNENITTENNSLAIDDLKPHNDDMDLNQLFK